MRESNIFVFFFFFACYSVPLREQQESEVFHIFMCIPCSPVSYLTLHRDCVCKCLFFFVPSRVVLFFSSYQMVPVSCILSVYFCTCFNWHALYNASYSSVYSLATRRTRKSALPNISSFLIFLYGTALASCGQGKRKLLSEDYVLPVRSSDVLFLYCTT